MLLPKFTRGEVIRLASLTKRELEWLDKQQIVKCDLRPLNKPSARRKFRQYSADVALLCMVIGEMKQRGLTLRDVRRVANDIARVCQIEMIRSRADLAAGPNVNHTYMVVEDHGVTLHEGGNNLARKCSQTLPPFIVVDLTKLKQSLFASTN